MASCYRSGFMEALVVSKKNAKTAKVAVKRKVMNKKYKMVRYVNKFYLVHDELDETSPGDKVIIRQSRPYSKLKSHIIWDITQKYKPEAFLQKHPELRPTGDEK